MRINQVQEIQCNLRARYILSCQNISAVKQKSPVYNLKDQIYIYTK